MYVPESCAARAYLQQRWAPLAIKAACAHQRAYHECAIIAAEFHAQHRAVILKHVWYCIGCALHSLFPFVHEDVATVTRGRAAPAVSPNKSYHICVYVQYAYLYLPKAIRALKTAACY